MTYPLQGLAGCLEFLDARFRGADRLAELETNRLFPWKHVLTPGGAFFLSGGVSEKELRPLSFRILDLFGGSGSSLIAAEKTGRKSFLMELDPLYTDVIVQRWEQFTGKRPIWCRLGLLDLLVHNH